MPITLTCSCGKRLQVDEAQRGKKAKCPACGQMLTIPDTGDETAVQADLPKRRSAGGDDDDAPPSRKRTERPQEKKSMAPWLIGGGCVVLVLFSCLGIAGAGAWFVLARTAHVAKNVAAAVDQEQKRAGGRAGRAESVNKLKQLGVAMHNHHDTFKGFPNHAILHPKTGAQLLSWRVSLLPFVEERDLYNQIRRDEPWDSPHNRQFWNRMPKVYQLPGKPADDKTYYQVLHGDQTAFPAKKGPPFSAVGIGMNTVVDGTSNTFMLVEAADPVNWMKPGDVRFPPGGQGFGMERLGNHWGDNSFNAVFCDGLVMSLRREMPPNDLRAMITRGGGEIVNRDQWRAP